MDPNHCDFHVLLLCWMKSIRPMIIRGSPWLCESGGMGRHTADGFITKDALYSPIRRSIHEGVLPHWPQKHSVPPPRKLDPLKFDFLSLFPPAPSMYSIGYLFGTSMWKHFFRVFTKGNNDRGLHGTLWDRYWWYDLYSLTYSMGVWGGRASQWITHLWRGFLVRSHLSCIRPKDML